MTRTNYSDNESEDLIRLVGEYYTVISCRANDFDSIAAKRKAWQEISNQLNALYGMGRTPQTVHIKWKNEFQKVKKTGQFAKKEKSKDNNPFRQAVLNAIGTTSAQCSGITKGYTTDSFRRNNNSQECTSNIGSEISSPQMQAIVNKEEQNDMNTCDQIINIQPPTLTILPTKEVAEGSTITFNLESPISIGGVFNIFKNGKQICPSFLENQYKMTDVKETDSGFYRCNLEVGKLSSDFSESIFLTVIKAYNSQSTLTAYEDDKDINEISPQETSAEIDNNDQANEETPMRISQIQINAKMPSPDRALHKTQPRIHLSAATPGSIGTVSQNLWDEYLQSEIEKNNAIVEDMKQNNIIKQSMFEFDKEIKTLTIKNLKRKLQKE